MSLELNVRFLQFDHNVRFSKPDRVVISFDGRESEAISFAFSLQDANRQDLRWYLETYAAAYTSEVDDQRSAEIEKRLVEWGKALFVAVFHTQEARRLFDDFQNSDEAGKLLTISANHPEILALPWELLCDSKYLVHDRPSISIRRRFVGAGGGRKPVTFQPKDRLRILMVVSRPSDVGFLDPRAEAGAMLAAIAAVNGRVDLEFLRPATIAALVKRLDDRDKPPIDVVHFDGHGGFDPDGQLFEQTKYNNPHLKSADQGANLGYLLFEDAVGKSVYITAETLAEMVYRRVGVIVLSACESARIGGEDGLGCVAAQLTHAGIGSVLAMSYKVLAVTTERLFAAFYERLLEGDRIGEALDRARRDLHFHPERGERQRGEERITLKLQDWFIPTLYQIGVDAPLLAPASQPLPKVEVVKLSNLEPVPEQGFFGRAWELWQIERGFVQGGRRITIAGFGGQGKTSLAQEAGRWLLQTGMFQRACLVDYSRYQGVDTVGYAVATLATVLDTNLLNADAVSAHRSSAVLVILDNLEVLEPEPLRELLDAGKEWSELGEWRVLLATRRSDLQHPDFPIEGSLRHRVMTLQGLGSERFPDPGLAYFNQLMRLSEPLLPLPERRALVELFKMVDFHPLSIKLLTEQLRTRRPADLGQRLEHLLQQEDSDDPNRSLRASLNLSLERVDKSVRQLLPRLGVFQGGAMEDDLVAIAGFNRPDAEITFGKNLLQAVQAGDVEELTRLVFQAQGESISDDELATRSEELGQEMLQKLLQLDVDKLSESIQSMEASGSIWQTTKQSLMLAGLIQTETLPGINSPYLKFHPTLAPFLWSELAEADQTVLLTRHWQRYHLVSNHLCENNDEYPYQVGAIAQRELPNLLFGVRRALEVEADEAVEFVENIILFLRRFGLRREEADLMERLKRLQVEIGSKSWYTTRSHEGQSLLRAGQIESAVQKFQEILSAYQSVPNPRKCAAALALQQLGRCYRQLGQIQNAVAHFREALQILGDLEESRNLKRSKAGILIDYGTAMRDLNGMSQAEKAYQEALKLSTEANDVSSQSIVRFQMATLKLHLGKPREALPEYLVALRLQDTLNEPEAKAIILHQLGNAYGQLEDLNAAEQCYRQSAEIKVSIGMVTGTNGVMVTWNALATLALKADKPDVNVAESYYRKVIKACLETGDLLEASRAMTNFATLLARQTDRLAEARQVAENALKIRKKLDPVAAEIWKTYGILAEITKEQGDPIHQEYLRLYRHLRIDSPEVQQVLQPFKQLIQGVVLAAMGFDVTVKTPGKEEYQTFESHLLQTEEGSINLVAAIRRIIAGERDEDILCDDLNSDALSIIISAILHDVQEAESLRSVRTQETLLPISEVQNHEIDSTDTKSISSTQGSSSLVAQEVQEIVLPTIVVE